MWPRAIAVLGSRSAMARDDVGSAEAPPLSQDGGVEQHAPRPAVNVELADDAAHEAHPFALFADALARVRRLRPIIASTDLQRHDGKPVYLLGWKVTAKRSETVKGEPMCFVTFSDEVGRFEASFFPEAYARCALELIRGMGPFLVKGKVEVAFGVAELVATHVKLLARTPAGAAASSSPFE